MQYFPFCVPIFICAVHCVATSTKKWHVCTNDFHRVSTCMLLRKDKLVVLTTEWLPWLHTSLRDSRFTFLLCMEDSVEKQLPCSSYNHNTLTTLRTSMKESLQVYIKVSVRNFPALNARRWFPHGCSEGCLCVLGL